ncbi:MAG: SagB/ThcOx family dehydrogenase [Muribaculaceae bacterium]|nr:SagB/ThcOx family dehydrogenase [Muribaculaceae bacterium]
MAENSDIALPAADMTAGTEMMEAFAQRKSIRKFADRELSLQDMGNLLWAAMGQNRQDGRLTAPSCRNFQEIRLFVFDRKGVSEYLPATHSLRHVVDGDYRNLVAAGQDFVNDAPFSLVMIADMTKFGNVDERAIMMASVDAGIVSENISLACAGLGLATVPRATMKSAEIISLLGLADNHIAIMNNPVGFEQKD